jgi:tetratricopeptide (TPR) repeat protein
MIIGSLASLRRPTCLGVLALSVTLAPRATAQPFAATTVADSAFQRSDWSTAAREYERVLARDSTGGYAWFRLGASRHALGDYGGAARALERAARIGFQPIGVQYRLARAYARLGDRDRALAHLDSAARRGLPPQQLQSEHDLDPIRGDARFTATVALAEATRYPCRAMPEAKQFDFWIGQWDVTPWALARPQSGQQIGTNDVQPILEHCVLLENWRAAAGGEGKSFNYYDTNLHRWRQVWMADSGGPLDYTGEYRDGAMRFTGWTLDGQGRRVEQKLTFFNIAPDTVRQLFEASSDSGRTWTSTFDGRYVRRKPPVSSPP